MSSSKQPTEKEASFTDFEQSYELASSRVGKKFLIKSSIILVITIAVIVGVAMSFGSLNDNVEGAFKMESKTLQKTFPGSSSTDEAMSDEPDPEPNIEVETAPPIADDADDPGDSEPLDEADEEPTEPSAGEAE